MQLLVYKAHLIYGQGWSWTWAPYTDVALPILLAKHKTVWYTHVHNVSIHSWYPISNYLIIFAAICSSIIVDLEMIQQWIMIALHYPQEFLPSLGYVLAQNWTFWYDTSKPTNRVVETKRVQISPAYKINSPYIKKLIYYVEWNKNIPWYATLHSLHITFNH